jgi:hypothetical protein
LNEKGYILVSRPRLIVGVLRSKRGWKVGKRGIDCEGGTDFDLLGVVLRWRGIDVVR